MSLLCFFLAGYHGHELHNRRRFRDRLSLMACTSLFAVSYVLFPSVAIGVFIVLINRRISVEHKSSMRPLFSGTIWQILSQSQGAGM